MPCRSRVLRSRSIHSPMPLICGRITSGTQTSNARPGVMPWNSGGATPTTVSARLLTVTVLPAIAGSAWKRRRHSASLITATG